MSFVILQLKKFNDGESAISAKKNLLLGCLSEISFKSKWQ